MRRLWIAAVLVLASSAVLADMYQDAKNAKLPEARENLELGTVKSEGGTAPNADAVTKFYTYTNVPGDDVGTGTKVQFQVNSEPDASDFAIEQAGKQNQGATRICTTILGTTADCNYVSQGEASRHLFANGAGLLAELGYTGTGPVTVWPQLLASDGTTAHLNAMGGSTANVDLVLKARGTGHPVLANDIGKIAQFESTGAATPDAYFKFQGANGGINRIIASSEVYADVGLELTSKGLSRTTVRLARGSQAMTTHTTQVPPYTVTVAESGEHYDNVGAVGAAFFNLPAAARYLHYCFTVDAAFQLRIVPNGTDKIAVGATNGSAGGYVFSAAPYASICLESHKAGQWITRSTPDKAQWTVT